MRYVTEQELQVKNRHQPFKELFLDTNERLTPEQSSFCQIIRLSLLARADQN